MFSLPAMREGGKIEGYPVRHIARILIIIGNTEGEREEIGKLLWLPAFVGSPVM